MASWGGQFSSGEQSHSIKECFWRSGFSKCQNMRCGTRNTDSRDKSDNKKTTIRSTDFPAGCRMNGDGYGTTVFTCTKCDWKTSFQYDDAAEVYYYETQHYKATPDPPPPPHFWSNINLQHWYSEHHISQKIQSKLQSYALGKEELSDMSFKHFTSLGLKSDEAGIVAAAVDKTNNELLNSTVSTTKSSMANDNSTHPLQQDKTETNKHETVPRSHSF